ncbi:trimethyllysine dioxygenase, partial [Tremellales sp. Uapishka_1]
MFVLRGSKEKRAEQNRRAQQAFRKKREEHIKKLEQDAIILENMKRRAEEAEAKVRQMSETMLIPADIRAIDVHSVPGGLRVEWSEGDHVSFYPYEFLQKASYAPPLAKTELEQKRVLWTKEIGDRAPSVRYEEVMADEGSVRDWLENVATYGFCLVEGVPANPDDTERLIRRIGIIRETHYGGFWDFTSNFSHGDLAYSSEPLPAHTDTTYFTDPAGLQIFHCLLAATEGGGESLLVDGFAAAERLKQLDEQAYEALSTIKINAHASGTKGSLLRPLVASPVLVHDDRGKLVQIRWNNEDRCVLAGLERREIKEWYRAARLFEAIVATSEQEHWFQLEPGTMVVIDNWRVMHGRSGFKGERRMCGAYVGADDWRSRLESLRAGEGNEGMWDKGW